jgi:hypothetical protein
MQVAHLVACLRLACAGAWDEALAVKQTLHRDRNRPRIDVALAAAEEEGEPALGL